MNRTIWVAWIVCFTLYPAVASAANFDLCVNEAKTNHSDTAAAGYTSYKCEGTTAEKLAARPDECAGGPKPSLRNLTRKSQQMDDGLYTVLSWTAGKCSGSCKTRSYDTKDTNYLCELRIYGDDSRPPADNNRELAPGPGAAGPGAAGPGTAGPGTAGPGTAGPGTASPGAAGPGATTPDATSPGAAAPGAPAQKAPGRDAGPGTPRRDATGPGAGRRQAAHEARLRRRPPPPGPVWAPPPPRRYSHPGFSRRPWLEPPAPPMPYEYDRYSQRRYPQPPYPRQPYPEQPYPECDCDCRGCY
jgi:hypothetical protein